MNQRDVRRIAYHAQIARDKAYAMRDRVPEKAELVRQFIALGNAESAAFHAANLGKLRTSESSRTRTHS